MLRAGQRGTIYITLLRCFRLYKDLLLQQPQLATPGTLGVELTVGSKASSRMNFYFCFSFHLFTYLLIYGLVRPRVFLSAWYVCVQVEMRTCLQVCEGQRTTVRPHMLCILLLFFLDGVPGTYQAGQTGWSANPGIRLSPSPACWNYKQLPLCLALYMSAWIQLRSSRLQGKPLPTEPPPQPLVQMVIWCFPSLSSTINLKVNSEAREGRLGQNSELFERRDCFSWNVPRAQVTKYPMSK